MTPAEKASIEDQLQQWVAGVPEHNKVRDECCPDFSCCRPHLLWPEEKRRKFVAADEGTREKMLLGALGALIGDELGGKEAAKVRITRGNPGDDL